MGRAYHLEPGLDFVSRFLFDCHLDTDSVAIWKTLNDALFLLACWMAIGRTLYLG